MRSKTILGLVALMVAGQSHAQLYATTNVGEVLQINTANGTGTLVYNLPNPDPCSSSGTTEIEYDPATGIAFAQSPNGAFCGYQFDINTGAAISGALNNGGSHTGLEVIGGTWFATVIFQGGGGDPSNLQILDPATGNSTLVGATGVNAISGLAYNGSILYGIAGGPGPANLYTINTGTGVATLVGATTIQAGSLEFGADGRLYAGGTGGNAGEIHIIDPATGASSLLGATGFGPITSLAVLSTPAPRVITTLQWPGLIVMVLLLAVVAWWHHRSRRSA